jgi:hypothetical protein
VAVAYNGSKKLNSGEIGIVRPYKNNIHGFRPQKDSVIVDLVVNDYDSKRPYKQFKKSPKGSCILDLDLVNYVSL